MKFRMSICLAAACAAGFAVAWATLAAAQTAHQPVAVGADSTGAADPAPGARAGGHGDTVAGHEQSTGHGEPAGHGAASGHGAAAGKPNPLVPDKPDLAVWTGVVFLALLAVLWKFAWGPIIEGLDKREKSVADRIAQADEANRQAQELLAQYERKLAESRDEVRAILDEARRAAEQSGRDLLERAKQEAAAERQRALRQIDSATAAALKELADRGAELALDLAGRIVGAELNPQQHTALVERAVADFAAGAARKAAPSDN